MSLRAGTRILTGDALAVLAKMPANTFHGCLTDPPYGLGEARCKRHSREMSKRGFMGMKWDADVPSADVWAEVLRVLKPGAFMLAFGGSRTFHRLAVAIEDAGFEIRDCIMWLYGQGFPKSHDIAKTIDTRRDWKALAAFQSKVKEARLLLKISQSEAARRAAIVAPGEKLAGGGFMWYETGRRLPRRDQYPQLKKALRLDSECDRVFEAAEREVISQKRGKDCVNGDMYRPGLDNYKAKVYDITAPATPEAQRWHGYGTALKPAHEPVLVCMKPTAGTFARNAIEHGVAGLAIDAARISGGRWPANVILDEHAAAELDAQSGASRFFYCAKASRKERGEGNTHPTVKPSALAEYLAKLILPPAGSGPRRLLVPFSGSGSEMIGAQRAGWDHITGVEQSAEYVAIAKRRTAAA